MRLVLTRSAAALLGLALLAACGSQPDEAASLAQQKKEPAPAPLAELRSAAIALPEDTQSFGTGPQAELLGQSCLACHSASMILYQPKLTRKQWTATVGKMREAYGAPLDPARTEAIVDALMAKAPSRK